MYNNIQIQQCVARAKALIGTKENASAVCAELNAIALQLLQAAKDASGAQRKVYFDRANDLRAIALHLQKQDAQNAQERQTDAAPNISADNYTASTKKPDYSNRTPKYSRSNVYTAPTTPYNTPQTAPYSAPNSAPSAVPNTAPAPTAPAKPKQTGSLAPQTLDEYIGQPTAVNKIRPAVDAAKLRQTACPHIMLYGSHGLGKTTLARIIASEMGVGFVEVNPGSITVDEMIAVLKKIHPRDIVFIDEVHTLPTIIAEAVLYSALTDCYITENVGKGKFAKVTKHDLVPFTLICATTEVGKVLKPLTHRTMAVRLLEYSDEIIGDVISKAFKRMGMNISVDNSMSIARRARNNPRTALSLTKQISDMALVQHVRSINQEISGKYSNVEAVRRLDINVALDTIEQFFQNNQIDSLGLESGDRQLLDILININDGKPVGLETLARAMNESTNVIVQKYESYLIRKGMISITREGRVATSRAYRHMGILPPDNSIEGEDKVEDYDNSDVATVADTSTTPDIALPAEDTDNESDQHDDTTAEQNDTEHTLPTYEVAVATEPDERMVDVITNLITYPADAQVFEQSLADILELEDRGFDSGTPNSMTLSVNFANHTQSVHCDSKLEARFIRYLAESGYISDIATQGVQITYSSSKMNNKTYIVDVIIKDINNRIAIIELKDINTVSYHLNIDKYYALQEFCTANGMGYAEVSKCHETNRYVAVSDIINMPINSMLHEYILDVINSRGQETGEGYFDESDWNNFVAINPDITRSELYNILFHDRSLTNKDRYGSSLRIELD